MAPLEPNLALIFIRWYFTEFYMTLHVVFGADRKFNLTLHGQKCISEFVQLLSKHSI